MSRQLGSELPKELLTLLDAHDLTSRVGKAILITTIDAQGWPHPALLSYGEVLALDARRLRLATYSSSGTSNNMRRSGRLTLCLIEARMAYYVKTRVEEQTSQLARFPALAGFEATVEQVLADQVREDVEQQAWIKSGITFETAKPMAEVLGDWSAVLNALRAAPAS
jgi:hypothetical protein